MLVNVVPLPSQPTWRVVVPTSSLVKVFVNLEDFVLLVQNVMKVVVSITSFVDVQVVKEIQVSHNSTYLLKMI
ncbi:Uncharacterised protein [Mycobacterium tuberculosis]|nr:Uncharacterised protein [Streptococcus pneumoniae]CIV49861.1 Uncharacterised protein [Streptococcus pneumoniae]CIV69091.1 Uncharacterised protein [Streptococcus pneumoniae]CKU47688.1 Uncharacterised protein [Mycobacterium tuberculosis]